MPQGKATAARHDPGQEARWPVDPVVVAITLALVMFGVIMVYSVSYPRSQLSEYTGYQSAFYVKRQALWAVIGLLFMAAAARCRPQWLRRLAPALLAVTVALLILVLFLGVEVQGARRWFHLGPVSFQPSELAKLATVLFLAHYCVNHREEIKSTRGLRAPMAVVGGICLLIVAERDLGTALVIGLVALATLAVAGARMRDLAVYAGVALLFAVMLIIVEPYRFDRIVAFVFPSKTAQDQAYQIRHCLIALGSGGVFGRGLGESREKFFYLPAATTDSIFAVIGEEMGLIGTIGLAFLFLWLAQRGLRIAYRSRDHFSAVAAAGITLSIVLQALINMAVVTSLIPTTGVPLPFISFGGSSLVLAMASIGVLLSISREIRSTRHAPQPVRRYRYADNPN